MGNCLSVFSVDFDELQRVRGSRDKALLAQIEAEVVESTPIVLPREDPPLDVPPPSAHLREAVRRIVFGGVWTEAQDEDIRDSMMLFLSECYGEKIATLPFRHVAAGLAEADVALDAFGLEADFTLTKLFTAGLPPELHYARPQRGRQSAGHVPATTVARAHDRLRGATWPHLRGKIANLLAIVEEVAGLAVKDGSGMLGAVLGREERTCLEFYTMRFDLVADLPGSCRDAVMARYDRWSAYDGDAFKPRLDLDDAAFLAWYRKQRARGNPKTSVIGAVKDILEAKPKLTRHPETYHAALAEICRLKGAELPNESVAPAAPQHLSAVDEALAGKGIADSLRLCTLALGGLPLGLPEAEDLPAAGHLRPDAVQAARGVLSGHDWNEAHPEVQRTIAMFDAWITHAAERREGLIAFYS